ncbi:uncharacterized protein LOC135384415 [Ornithodoros turicata]|uniref:uncharacterized protein LOC135384415 n=1 Tax=Ornithodoros turicata TaxID=34597 RepID=UPI003139F89E
MYVVGKHRGQPLMAVGGRGPNSRYLFYVVDRVPGTRFLVNTGAEVSVISAGKLYRRSRGACFTVKTANSSSIPFYGQESLALNIGLRRDFRWLFLVADVTQVILGADFLRTPHQQHDVAFCACPPPPRLSTSRVVLRYARVLVRVHLEGFSKAHQPPDGTKPVHHDVVHNVVTHDPPARYRPQRLGPGEFNVAKAPFVHMLQLGIIRPSSSTWACPLRMVPKRTGAWPHAGIIAP